MTASEIKQNHIHIHTGNKQKMEGITVLSWKSFLAV